MCMKIGCRKVFVPRIILANVLNSAILILFRTKNSKDDMKYISKDKLNTICVRFIQN